MSTSTYSELIRDAITACEGLVMMMEEETLCLKENRLELVEEIAASKGRLAGKLEKLLSDVKALSASVDKEAHKDELAALKAAIDRIEQPASTNLNMLQARHTATSNFLTAVRQALAKPQPKTYGKSGKVAESDENTALINRSI